MYGVGPGYRADLGEYHAKRHDQREAEPVEIERRRLRTLIILVEALDCNCEDCPLDEECREHEHAGHICVLAVKVAREAIG